MDNSKNNYKLYRGESGNFHKNGEEFKPSLNRNIESIKQINDYILKTYTEEKELSIFPRVKDVQTGDKRIQFLGLFQHYGMRTPLLDVSSSKDVSTYFACCEQFDKDGYIYSFDLNFMSGLNTKTVENRMKIIWEGFVDEHYTKSTLNKIYSFDYKKIFKNANTVLNLRYTNQKGHFILYGYNVDEGYTPIYVPYKEPDEVIKNTNKIYKLIDLSLINGITKIYLFPDIDESISVKRDYRLISYLKTNDIDELNEWDTLKQYIFDSKNKNLYYFMRTDLKKYYEYIYKFDYSNLDSEQNKLLKYIQDKIQKISNNS